MGALRKLQKASLSQNRETAEWKIEAINTKETISGANILGIQDTHISVAKEAQKYFLRRDLAKVCPCKECRPHASNWELGATGNWEHKEHTTLFFFVRLMTLFPKYLLINLNAKSCVFGIPL